MMGDCMATTQSVRQPQSMSANWTWLFPLTYVLHIAEEYRGGEGFPSWILRVAGSRLRSQDFLILNGIGLVLMIAFIAMIGRRASWRWTLTAIAGVVLLNAVSHAIASVITRSYSPGTVTGLILWLPLSLFTLRHEWRNTPRSTFRAGTVGAVGLHILICFLAIRG
jgi:Protein of unknown function with HXXEE motif